MAIWDTINSGIDAVIYPNGAQLITGGIHNSIAKAMVAAAGASQIAGPVAESFSPGIPDHYQAYLLLPGTYPNFAGITVTTALALVKWNGSTWVKTDIPIPVPTFARAVTSEALTEGAGYSSFTIDQAAGGWTALAGQWVRVTNPATGRSDYFQLTADMADTDIEIFVEPRYAFIDLPVGSYVELYPTIGMRRHVTIPVVGAPINFVTLPTDWRTPPIECIAPVVYSELFTVIKNSSNCIYSAAPVSALQWKLDDADRLKLTFGEILEAGDHVTVYYNQPAVLELFIP